VRPLTLGLGNVYLGELVIVYTPEQILSLLPLLDEQIADELENETLDFKECHTETKLREIAKEMAICMGNASGGTVVFGVRERVLGCDKAIVGLDFAPDLAALNAMLYDSIDPKLPVQFEWLPYGSRRLLLMHVHPSMPPYTTTSGKGWMRIGKDFKPLTGSLLRQLRERAGLRDQSAKPLPFDDPFRAISPAAIEILRREMKKMESPSDLLACNDQDLCGKLGFLKNDRLTIAGLLVAGRDEFIAEHVPNHEWKYSKMRTDTDYETPPVSGRDCILVALDKIMLLLGVCRT